MLCRAIGAAGGQATAGRTCKSELPASCLSTQPPANSSWLLAVTPNPPAQGKLYLYESSAPGAKLAATEAVWAADRRVVRVPPENIGGAEHVVALCPGKCIACCCVTMLRGWCVGSSWAAVGRHSRWQQPEQGLLPSLLFWGEISCKRQCLIFGDWRLARLCNAVLFTPAQPL